MAGNNLTSLYGASSLSRDAWIKMRIIKIINSVKTNLLVRYKVCFYVFLSDENIYVRIQQWNQLSSTKDQANSTKVVMYSYS